MPIDQSEVETIEQIGCDLCGAFVVCARFWVARCQVHLDVCGGCLRATLDRVDAAEEGSRG